MKTLVEKAIAAKTINNRCGLTLEHEALAIAWIEGIIVSSQLAKAMHSKWVGGQQAYTFVARAILQAVTSGRLQLVKTKAK